MVQLFAETAAAVTSDEAGLLWAKAIMLGLAFGAAAIGLAIVGSSYMKALGRNPEAGKVSGQIIIIAAMIEVTALLAFLLGAFLLG